MREKIGYVEQLLADLDSLHETRKRLRERIEIVAKDQYKKLEDISQQKENLVSLENEVKAKIREVGGNLSRKQDEINDEITATTYRLKKEIHDLPAREVEEGRSLSGSNLKAVISKTQVSLTYKSEEILEKYPWVRRAFLSDGSLAIHEIVRPEAIEELVGEGKLPSSVNEKYAVYTKVRSPSVRIVALEKTNEV